jgi:hypothetical protein
MIYWNYMLVAAAALLVFLLYKEWTRKSKARLYGRLAASLLAVTSLLFMAYPYAEKNGSGGLKKIILLTDGFIKDSVENFLHQVNAGIPVFSDAAVSAGASPVSPVQLVTDWTAFASKHAADTIHVFGNGVSKETLSLLHPHPIVFHANPVSPAVSHIYWKKQVQSGKPVTVQGHYENSTGKKIKIVLQAFGADKDSAFMDAFTSRDFLLHTIPVHNGKAVYSLIVVAEKDTLAKEPVPVDVQTVSPLQLLIISSSPDFEYTFLKNHLSQQGYQITVSTIISSNKTDRQFLNMPVQQQAMRLTVPYLAKFDVMMADEEVLQKISTAEMAAIRSVVQDKGTGLLIKMEAQKKGASFYSRFFPVKALRQDKQSFSMLRGAFADSIYYKIKIADPVSIEYTPGVQMILQDAQSNMFAAGIVYGSGKIVATTLQNSYGIALAGDKTSYQQLWWLLLNKAAKKIYPDESWQTNPFIPKVNSPVQLVTENNDGSQPKAVLPGTSIYLQQDALLSFQWQGKYWPSASGWQPLPRVNMQSGEWYVFNTADWKQLTDYNNTKETKKYTALHPVSFENTSNHQAGLFLVNWSLIMLIIFLSSCVFLWVEQKAG